MAVIRAVFCKKGLQLDSRFHPPTHNPFSACILLRLRASPALYTLWQVLGWTVISVTALPGDFKRMRAGLSVFAAFAHREAGKSVTECRQFGCGVGGWRSSGRGGGMGARDDGAKRGKGVM